MDKRVVLGYYHRIHGKLVGKPVDIVRIVV
ncbi:MAG: hypothetical protein BWY17_00849 [Deltaproteobacteria bacterium ADurb.Bin207]|nr:MAG: hypothetical protein BWY17_00849 [Deltaproteobacteria bacterium ADurb.Bin207]